MSDITQSTGSAVPKIKHANRNASVKQNLFRFVHIKEVEISTDTSNDNLIYAVANSNTSTILNTVKPLENPKEIEQAVKDWVATFKPIKSYKEANALSPKLAQLAQWLKNNKKNLKLNEIRQAVEQVKTLTTAEEKILWDNLFYFIISNKASTLRNVVLKLIQANHFATTFHQLNRSYTKEKFTVEQKQLIEQVASASIMIPPVLFSKPSKSTSLGRNTQGDKYLKKSNEQAILNHQINTLTVCVDAFEKIEKLYQKENHTAYTIAHKKHEEATEKAYANAKKVVNPDTGEVSYENLILPDFQFEAKNPFEKNFLANNLPQDSFALYQNIYHQKVDSYKAITEDLNQQINRKYSQLQAIDIVPSKTIAYNGSIIEVNYTPNTLKVVSKEVATATGENKKDLYLSIYHPNTNESITDVSISINANEKLEGKFIAEKQGVHTYKFSNATSNFSSKDENIFSGNFKSGDQSFSFGKKGYKPNNSTIYCTIANGDYCYFDEKYKAWICTDKNGSLYAPITDLSKYCTGGVLDGEPGKQHSPMYGVKKVGIAEYKRVEQELCCYVEGEVSHIENIMAREYKEKASRSLNRSETTTETTQEREAENLSDTTSTDRHELQQEVAQVLENSKEFNYGASTSVSASYGGMITLGLDANMGGSSSSSASNSFNTSESFAKEVVERAMERVVKKSSHKRTSRMLREYEENNKHGFDNRKGDQHVTGIYRWVDKIYRNKLVNYGKRLSYEFAIPEPAKDWKNLIQTKVESSMVKPTKPEIGINDWRQINKTNYANLAAKFNADVEAPLDNEIIIGKSFEDSKARADKEGKDYVVGEHWNQTVKTKADTLKIPDGYQTKKAKIYGKTTWSGSGYGDAVIISLGKEELVLKNSSFPGFKHSTSLSSVQKELPIAIASTINGSYQNWYSFSLEITCELTTEEKERWQKTTYQAIYKAYKDACADYNDALALWEIHQASLTNKEKTIEGGNPTNNRRIEQTELKKTAIRYMLSQVPAISLGQNFRYNENKHCANPIMQSAQLNNYTEHIQFLEEAIDWKLMAYTFHPYFWASCNEWKNLVQVQNAADPLFETFLQAGFATLKVPVSAGYEKAILFFLDTGRIWKKGDVLVDDLNNEYKSIAKSLRIEPNNSNCCRQDNGKETTDNCNCCKKELVCVEAEWTTRIPTALTIIQDHAAPLAANGLPCFSKKDTRVQFCEDGTPLGGLNTNNTQPNNGLMVGQTESSTTVNNLTASIQSLIQVATPLVQAIAQFWGKNPNAQEQLRNEHDRLEAQYADWQRLTQPEIDCSKAPMLITNLKQLESEVATLIANAQSKGLDTQLLEALQSKMKDSLHFISQKCPQ